MKSSKKPLNSRQRKSLLKTFFISSGMTVIGCLLAVIVMTLFYNKTVGAESSSQVKPIELTEEEKVFEEEKEETSTINKTIAVFGVDEDEIRTDVILVANFNSATGKAKVVSIPRDTKVLWSDKQKRAYTDLTGYSISVSKLNEMAAYGKINENVGNIRDFTIDEIENILRVKIDNYVVINLDAFREIVDIIGGVEVDVPQRMYYQDRSQGLYIDLQPGLQHLDSEDAEGLVRFRRYIEGDEKRVEVQQLFLKAVAQKVLSREMLGQLPNMITKLFPYIKTDIKLTDVLSYLTLLNDFDLQNLTFYTVPGYGSSEEGPSYYYINEDKLEEMIKEVFYNTEEEQESSTEQKEPIKEILIDKEVTIEIYNGAGVKGLASRYKDQLMLSGYEVVRFDNYETSDIEKSIIYTKDRDKALQFEKYIPEAEIIQNTSIDSDIKIILGRDALES